MAILKIQSDIVDEESRQVNMLFFGIDGTSFQSVDEFVSSIPQDDDTIDIKLHCRGGSCMEGWAIYDRLRASGKKIKAEIVGQCASMASVILLAAPKEERRGHPNSKLNIHFPYYPPFSLYEAYNEKELQKLVDRLKEEGDNIVSLYIERTEADEQTLRALMDEDKYISMDEAKELGFISEIIPPLSAAERQAKFHQLLNSKMENVEVKQSFFDKLLAKAGYAKIEDAQKALEIVNIDLTTADGSTITVERENGDPQVGDNASPDGSHLMPDGSTIVITEGVITEILPEEEKTEETDAIKSANELVAKMKTQITALKSAHSTTISAKDQEIENLKKSQKTAEENEVLEAAKKIGGIQNLKKAISSYKVPGRDFASSEGDGAVSKIEKHRQEMYARHEARKNKK